MPVEPNFEQRVVDALRLIARTPGYTDVAADLERLSEHRCIRFVPDLPDRAQATLSGKILMGPEPLEGGPVGFAQTLVHEHFHLKRQFPLQKTVSFWAGVATRTPVMQRYERPAYQSALAFLATVAATFPEHAAEARQEAEAVRAVFAACYQAELDV